MDRLPKSGANYVPLTPLTFLTRASNSYAKRTSIIYANVRFTWRQTYERCCRLASSLRSLNIVKNDVVSVLAPNVPAMLEMHFAVPMAGAVLNAINTRLDSRNVALILKHSEAKIFFVDYEYIDKAKKAIEILMADFNMPMPLIVVIDDLDSPTGIRLGELEYEQLVHQGNPKYVLENIDDEWDPITLSYTSGTTSEPKGVVYSHRGAFLSTLSLILGWEMGTEPVYLWSLPMFHCNGWTFTWGIAARGDMGVIHPDGYLEIKDRCKDVIISGGENISSVEVESAIMKHPYVVEASVVAMPHPRWGESPCAFVILRKNSNFKESDIIAHCRKNLPGFMVPKKVQFVEELPKTGTGKVQKNHLRAVAKTFVIKENANQTSKKSTQVNRKKPRAYDQSHEQILALSRL
ncbi:hypothetical protein K7X08_033506 [Anisodus acutangulus]|uniref:4-coumarate--CoA ligase n=1 Tax=Anisodus acutangulus TaxID=402998 RepID=A0A9Q1M6S0_9SOLA|nr:hypothetical protein K7X08_033506 [Anisodus acutangulus]